MLSSRRANSVLLEIQALSAERSDVILGRHDCVNATYALHLSALSGETCWGAP